jgi:hypothetical protein
MPAMLNRANRLELLSPPVDLVVETNADTVSAFIQEFDIARRAAWQTVIDETLLNWLNDPSQLDDENITPPSPSTIRLAIDFAEQFRDRGYAPAVRIVPDASGGIVIERTEAETLEVIHIWEDGQVEYQQFRGPQLILRHSY